MPIGHEDGHGETSHSVDTAALAIESLLSGDDSEEEQLEDAPPDETPEESGASDDDSGVEEPTEPTEDESESEEEPTQPVNEPRKFKVKAAGQELEVTEEELLRGYSREQDYTRKQQALATQRKEFEEQELTPVRAERQRYATQLAELETAVKSLTQEPEWDKLRAEDPALFAETHAAWQLHQSRIRAIETERQAAEEAVRQDFAQQQKAHLTAERQRLVEKIPAWKDAAVAKTDRAAMVEYAKETGFTEEELGGVADHRALVLLHKAMLYDRAEAAKKTVQKKAADKIESAMKVVTPGPSGENKPKVTELTRRKSRLGRTGSIHDAASALELMFDD